MPKISLLVPGPELELIDSVSENRSAFMIAAAVAEAKQRRRELEDAEIASICSRSSARDRAIATDWTGTLHDGLSK